MVRNEPFFFARVFTDRTSISQNNPTESLKKWKESLGLNTQQYYSPPDDSRAIVVLHLAMETEGRPDVVMKLDTKEDIEALKKTSMVIKEGTIFCLKATFRVQHDVVCGLKYIHVVKRKGIRVDKMEEMLGSYGPSETPYVKKVDLWAALILRMHLNRSCY